MSKLGRARLRERGNAMERVGSVPISKRRAASWAVCLGVLCGAGYVDAARAPSPSLRAQSSPTPAGVSPRAVIDKYCVTCHSERLKRGDLVLEKLDVDHVETNIELWEKVVKKLHSGLMPPAGVARPDKPTYQGFITALEDALD